MFEAHKNRKVWTATYVDCAEAVEIINDNPMDSVVLDTETTGLDDNDEILEFGMINCIPYVKWDMRFKSTKTSWAEAEAVHHISPADVKQCVLTFADRAPQITAMLAPVKLIIGYNVGFDIRMMRRAGVVFPDNVKICDVMEDFAVVYGDWNEYYQSFRWKKLTVAAEHYGISTEGAHGQIADCRMTLAVLKKIAAEPESVRRRGVFRCRHTAHMITIGISGFTSRASKRFCLT